MTPETKANMTEILQHTTPAALAADGWTVTGFEIDHEQQLRGALGLRGTATKGDETARLLSVEHKCDDRHKNHQLRVTMIRPDHSHIRITRKLFVMVTASVLLEGEAPSPKGAAVPNEDTRPAHACATLPDLGPEFVAAREKLRATVDQLMTDGSMGCDPLKCMAVVATALLGQMTADRDRLAAELAIVNAGRAAGLDLAYDEGWREGCGSAGVDFGGAADS